MQKNIYQIALHADPIAEMLVRYLEDAQDLFNSQQSYLYHKFPFYVGPDNSSVTANVLLVSSDYGVLLFQGDDATSRSFSVEAINHTVENLEQIYAHIYSKLVKSKILRNGPNTLKVPIKPCLFIPNVTAANVDQIENDWEDLQVVVSAMDLSKFLKKNRLKQPLLDHELKSILSILEGSEVISKKKPRMISDQGSRAGILQKIESEIALFDEEQKRAAMHVVEGFQRIRGLAGSGKTIVLTMKAALIHLHNPEAKILYTFYTKSLYGFIKQLITKFYRQFADADPNWDNIHILHAWGGHALPGVYYNACIDNGKVPASFKATQVSRDVTFDKLCADLCQNDLKEKYEYSILDEGQDFPVHFYRLCRKITHNNNVIWGYDECQNILNIDIQNTQDTFGINPITNKYYCDFSKSNDGFRDIILHTCYRNPRRILVSAFALGFGIYNNQIIQMLENNAHWEDIGFHVEKGSSNIGDDMVISRPEEHSPLALIKELEADSVIQMAVFQNLESECKYIVDRISDDLKQSLLPEDILVISLDDRNARTYFKCLAKLLLEKNVNTFDLLDAPTFNTDFFVKDHVTLSTVYRAKGNEAASVYIVGVDSIFEYRNSIQHRNKLFTAMSRAKGFVTLTGIGREALVCKNELDKVLKQYPNLVFKMPDMARLKRDLAEHQQVLNEFEQMISKARRQGISEDEMVKRIRKTKKSK